MRLPASWHQVTVEAYARASGLHQATSLGYSDAERARLLAEALLGRRITGKMPDLGKELAWMAQPCPVVHVSSWCLVGGCWLAGEHSGAVHQVKRPPLGEDAPMGVFMLLEDRKLTAPAAAPRIQSGELLPHLLATIAERGPFTDRTGLRARLAERQKLYAGMPLPLALGAAAHHFAAYPKLMGEQVKALTGEPEERAIAAKYGLHWVTEGYRARKGMTKEQVMQVPASEFFGDLEMFAFEAAQMKAMHERIHREAQRKG
jgi:hypothetical protein